MLLDFEKLLTKGYYLAFLPTGDFLWGYPLLALFIGLFFFPSLCEKLATHNKALKKSMKGQFWKFYFFGTIGVILVLSRFAGVPGFSMRLWLYLNLFLTVFFGLLTAWDIRKGYQRRLDSVEREKGKRW